jgi:hypothetical protein
LCLAQSFAERTRCWERRQDSTSGFLGFLGRRQAFGRSGPQAHGVVAGSGEIGEVLRRPHPVSKA